MIQNKPKQNQDNINTGIRNNSKDDKFPTGTLPFSKKQQAKQSIERKK